MTVLNKYTPEPTTKLTLEWITRQLHRIGIATRNDPVFTPPTQENTGNRVGTLTSGSLSDMQTLMDGNEINYTEVAAAPGGNFEFQWDNLRGFQGLVLRAYYESTATHYWLVQVYDYANTAWRTVLDIRPAYDHEYHYMEFPSSDGLIEDGTALVRIRHPSTGIITHDLFIDYLAIVEQVNI